MSLLLNSESSRLVNPYSGLPNKAEQTKAEKTGKVMWVVLNHSLGEADLFSIEAIKKMDLNALPLPNKNNQREISMCYRQREISMSYGLRNKTTHIKMANLFQAAIVGSTLGGSFNLAEVVRFCLKNKADPLVKNSEGQNALDLFDVSLKIKGNKLSGIYKTSRELIETHMQDSEKNRLKASEAEEEEVYKLSDFLEDDGVGQVVDQLKKSLFTEEKE